MSSDGTDFEGGEEFPERPFGGRPFGGRPFGGRRGEERPFGGRPFGGRPFGGRPFGGRPFGGRPFGGRPFGGRPFGGRRGEAEGDGYLDPDEWSADVAELVCERSAVIRLGATLVASDQELPVNAFDAQAGFRAPGAAGPPAAVGVPGAPAMLHPGDHELEAGVVVTPEVRRALEANPGLADEIKVDLAEALARGADQQFLQTIAAHVPPPLGVVPGDLLATARGVVAAVRPAGPPFPPVFRNPGWILAPETLELLTTLPTADCLVAGGPGARTLDSYRILQLDGVDGGEVGRDGRPTGVLKEAAADRARGAVPRPTEAEWARHLAESVARAHALGITGVHDCVEPPEVRAYQELRRQGRLTLRASLMPYAESLDALAAAGFRTGFGDEWLRLGAVKVFADGSLGARTAALFDPYDDEPRAAGGLVRSPKDLTALLARAHAAGFQAAVHAIGDRAIDVVVEAYARVLDREPRRDHRHRIEHLELPSEEVLDRMRDLGLVASMQPNFVARWSGPGGLYERRLGRARLERNNPFREIVRRRIPLAFGSDGMPYGPLAGLAGAVDAPFPAQRIPATAALRAYTAGGAFAGFAESDVGTLAVGKFADFVILTGDPRRDEVAGLAVDATVVGGSAVYRRSRAT